MIPKSKARCEQSRWGECLTNRSIIKVIDGICVHLILHYITMHRPGRVLSLLKHGVWAVRVKKAYSFTRRNMLLRINQGGTGADIDRSIEMNDTRLFIYLSIYLICILPSFAGWFVGSIDRLIDRLETDRALF